MMSYPALQELKRFVEDPTRVNATKLVRIPALMNALKAGWTEAVGYPASLRALARFMIRRGEEVYEQLRVHDTPDVVQEFEERDWRKVSRGLRRKEGDTTDEDMAPIDRLLLRHAANPSSS